MMKYRIVNINTAAPYTPKSSILIIYTGGTFGMMADESGSLVSFNFNQIIKRFPSLRNLELKLTVISFPEPIDSSDITPSNWVDLAYIIYENYQQYDGFVILHGTDTMAYSASALSFLLEDLNKPIIFTGAQLPIGAIRTDARANLITALEIASAKTNGEATVPEVCIYFDYMLMRGNRVKKVRSSQFSAFESENYPILAKAGISIDYNHAYIKKVENDKKLKYYRKFDTSIAVLKIFPGINKAIIDSILRTPELKAVVFETFGSGNAMTESWFINSLKDAINNGIIIYNVSQCSKGKVIQGRYRTSSILKDIGVISGSDVTFEAAITKMMFLLAHENDGDRLKIKLKTNLRGEMQSVS